MSKELTFKEKSVYKLTLGALLVFGLVFGGVAGVFAAAVGAPAMVDKK